MTITLGRSDIKKLLSDKYGDDVDFRLVIDESNEEFEARTGFRIGHMSEVPCKKSYLFCLKPYQH